MFVHGFRGSAIDTWLDFPFRLPREPKVARYDLYNFGYDTRDQAGASAGLLRQFLRTIGEKPATIVNASLPHGAQRREATLQYEHIVIAAHSLGALVTRLALLLCVDDARQPLPWLARVRLALFAPAHSGALAGRLATMLLLGVKAGSQVEAVARRIYRSINDLDPHGETIEGLNGRTEALLAAGPDDRVECHRAWVRHAQGEWVVRIDQFHEDRPYDVWAGLDHFGVCKPDRGESRPLEFLLDVIP